MLWGNLHHHWTYLFCIVAPLGPPVSLQFFGIQATAFTLYWSLPPASQRVGSVITVFDLNCTSDEYLPWSIHAFGSSTRTFRRSQAEEYTEYTCCVAAVRNSGVSRIGRGRCGSVLTREAGKTFTECILVHLLVAFNFCLNNGPSLCLHTF